MTQIDNEQNGICCSRNFWMDLLRCYAILCVVIRHSIEWVYNMGAWQWEVLDNYNRAIRTMGHVFGSQGVPIFLFLSGALLLKKQIDEDKGVIQFYKHNFLPLLLSCEIWIVIYYIFNSFLYKTDFIISDLISYMLFFNLIPVMNMWYVPLIIGLYIAVPFISIVVRKLSIMALIPAIVINVLIWFILPNVRVILNVLENDIDFSTYLDLNFMGGIFGIYLVLGFYIVDKQILKRLPTSVIILIGILSFVLTCIYVAWIASRNYEYKTEYNLFFLLVLTICVLECFRRFPERKSLDKRLFYLTNWTARASFGIYLFHVIFVEIMKAYFPFDRYPLAVGFVIMLFTALIGSILTIRIISGKKKFCKILLLMK